MKKLYFIASFLVLAGVYGIGFFHGINSDFIKKQVREKLEEKEKQSYESYITNSFGLVRIESIGKNRETAEIDFMVKMSTAKMNRWTPVGKRFEEKKLGEYRIYQTIMRFPD